jgi:phosphoglycerate dehydrogenase-like enzyme
VRTVFVHHPRRATIDRALAQVRTIGDRSVVVIEDPEELAERLPEIEALVVSVPPRGIWERATRLRLLHLAGVGAEQLLPAPDLPAHVRIACPRGVFAIEAAEHVIATMLALVRRLPDLVRAQQHQLWRRHEAERLAGKTLAILGLGEIGRRVARIARAMEMRVVATRRSAAPDPDADEVYGPEHTHDLLAMADAIVVALPLTDSTRRLIDDAALARCRPHAVLVSIARAGVVDESALVDALVAVRLAGAALDGFDPEPLPPDSGMWSVPNLLVTPHSAGFGLRYAARVLEHALDNVARLEGEQPLLGEIDRNRGY